MTWHPAHSVHDLLNHAGAKADPPITITRAVQTAFAVPSQWNAWTVDGQYLYLRYRFGHGTVDSYPSEDMDTWDRVPEGNLACFGDCFPRKGFDGEIGLGEFCERAGLVLAPDAVVVSWDEHVQQAKGDDAPQSEQDDPPVQCWHTEPGTPRDWDICRQPERLAAGDCGTDPARGVPMPRPLKEQP
jgi:hypothetical protein